MKGILLKLKCNKNIYIKTLCIYIC